MNSCKCCSGIAEDWSSVQLWNLGEELPHHSISLIWVVGLDSYQKIQSSRGQHWLCSVLFRVEQVRAKRDPSLCNESVNGHFWSNLCLNCIFKWTWFVKTDIWSVIDGSRVRFPVAAALIVFLFSPHFSLFFWLGSPSVPLEFPKLANAQPSNFGPLLILL